MICIGGLNSWQWRGNEGCRCRVVMLTGPSIELRIHEHTERGDNDSVKQAGKGTIANPVAGGCCGGGAAAR